MRSPGLTGLEVGMRKPFGGDPTVRSALAMADPVPG
jgi:hypothetical protein